MNIWGYSDYFFTIPDVGILDKHLGVTLCYFQEMSNIGIEGYLGLFIITSKYARAIRTCFYKLF
jgi:hypothetical protein